MVALEKIVGCNDWFPPALNHCRPGQNEGDETGITVEISVKAGKADGQPRPRVPPWEDSLGSGMLEFIGATWKEQRSWEKTARKHGHKQGRYPPWSPSAHRE